MKNSQSGVALIAVLLFLILITIAGVVAVRQSSVDLKVATSDQAGTLMLNASDSILANLEQTSNVKAATSPDQATRNEYKAVMSELGVLGYYLPNAEKKVGQQVAFCYRPNTPRVFNVRAARIMQYGGGFVAGGSKDSICNSGDVNHYISQRFTTMTQVVIRGLEVESADDDNFGTEQLGEQTGTGKSLATDVKPRIAVHSVSVLPTLSSATNDEIKACLEQPAGDRPDLYKKTENMTACLKKIGVPSTALVEDGQLLYETQGGRDSELGGLKDTGGQGKLGTICQNNASCQPALQK